MPSVSPPPFSPQAVRTAPVPPPVQPAAAPVFAGACLHCGFQIPPGVMFCGNCGKQAGTAPPPKPRRFCQGCGAELADGLKFCQYCGQQAPGLGFKLPAGANAPSLDGAKKLIGGLNISIQRLALMVASFLGVLSGLFPWYSAKYAGITITANAFGVKALGESQGNVLGVISVVVFAAALVLCFLGDRRMPVGNRKFVFAAAGVVNLAIGISQFVVFNGEEYEMLKQVGGIGFGLYLLVLMAIAICAIPFVKQLEQ